MGLQELSSMIFYIYIEKKRVTHDKIGTMPKLSTSCAIFKGKVKSLLSILATE